MSKGFFKQNAVGILALVAVAALGLSGALKFRGLKKIGFAETSVLLSEFSEAAEARKKFEESQKEWDKNLKTLNDSLITAMNALKEHYDSGKKEEKEKLQATLQRRNEDLQRYSNAVKKMSQDKEKELMEPVIKKLNSFLETWGKQHGYDLILGTMTGGNILQANAELNVTSQVLKDLNETYKTPPASEGGVSTLKNSGSGNTGDSAAKVENQ